MKEEIKKKVDPAIEKLDMHVSSVYTEKVEGVVNLNIELDSDKVIDTERITEASRIINDIIDEMDIPMEGYILDIHSKEKGEN